MATSNIQNLRFGVCTVTYNGVNLGHTKGGITVKYEPKMMDVMVDQYGSTPVAKVLTGENLRVKIPFAELTSVQWDIAIAAGTQSGQTVQIGANAGSALTGYPLILTPLAASKASETITLWSAVVDSPSDVKYAPDQQSILEVEFTAIINESKAVGNRLGTIGFVS